MGKGGLAAAGMIAGATLAPFTGGASLVASMAIGAAVGGAIGGTLDSSIATNRETHRAKAREQDQQRAIAKQEAEALSKRKDLIDRQRMQLGATGRGTRGSSLSGVKATIPTTETLG